MAQPQITYFHTSALDAEYVMRCYENTSPHTRIFPIRSLRYEDLQPGLLRRAAAFGASGLLALMPHLAAARKWFHLKLRTNSLALTHRLDRLTPELLGVCILTDFERMTDSELADTIALHEGLCAAGCRVLNNPARTLRRFDLLHKLHAEGLNDFAVYRLTDDVRPTRFPVFIRREDIHAGPESDLLHNQSELEETIARYRSESKAFDCRIVVEFCDTRSADGLYRKYGAFIVGGQVVPRHLFFSQHWVQKLAGNMEAHLDEEWVFLQTNPHGEQIARIAHAANIDYGRIDYGVRDGCLQVWEINTHPVMVKPIHFTRGARLPFQHLFAQRYFNAMSDLVAARR